MESISRRTMVQKASLAGVTLAAAVPAAFAENKGSVVSPAVLRKRKVVVTGGHPGDPECGCGGLLARLADAGDDLVLLYLNKGDPSEDSIKGASPVRVEEAQKACAIFGAHPVFAGQVDAHAVVDAARYDQFFKLLELENPDAVFTHWPIDNHRDHRAMSMLVYDAWLRLKKQFALYYYEVSNGEDTVQFAPTDWVDITHVESRKRQACFAHASQNPEKFYALQDRVSQMRGLEKGCKLAEGYIRHVQSPPFALP